MRFGSLFAGIGGFDLGLERSGMQCGWQVEIDPYATKILEKHWPNVPRWADVRTFPPPEGDWEVDVICGGFPCQDISFAGKGAGLAGARSGLWYEFARIIGVLRPRYVVVENVAALLVRGMGDVLGTLASLGYDAEWHVIPASAVGAPHRRERVWIVAYANGISWHEGRASDGEEVTGRRDAHRSCVGQDIPHANRRRLHRFDAHAGDGGAVPEQGTEREFRGGGSGNDVADADCVTDPVRRDRQAGPCGLAGRDRNAGGGERDCGAGCAGQAGEGSCVPDVKRNGPQRIIEAGATLRPVDGGRGDWWAVEPDVGRVAHGVPARVDRLRCLGNAVVPQVVELIGRAILKHEAAAGVECK